MVDLTVKTMDLLWAVFFWAVFRYAPTVAVEMLFVILVIIVTMLGLDILRMCLTWVPARNDLNPLETLAQVEEEQNYETSEKILRDDATLSELCRLIQFLSDEGNTSTKVL
ncbi:unnamed protein product [Brassica rapa subsp. narinosa]